MKEGRDKRGERSEIAIILQAKFWHIKIWERDDGDEIINDVTIIRSNIV